MLGVGATLKDDAGGVVSNIYEEYLREENGVDGHLVHAGHLEKH